MSIHRFPTKPSQPSQRAAASARRGLAEKIFSPIAFLASSYVSIFGLVLIFSMNRIGRLTSPSADSQEI